MWHYDQHGNFVGDEDRPDESDMGFVFAQLDEKRKPDFTHMTKALEKADLCTCRKHAWDPNCPAHGRD